ncbi:hypothetical protein WJX84_010909 [Apatococcus fuscideae]|uniref:Uncharacterized protein n=1 Tax=Apatococcus fuscideae TaxID=2026836 RepID=A0AAW1T8P9_9CHLO
MWRRCQCPGSFLLRVSLRSLPDCRRVFTTAGTAAQQAAAKLPFGGNSTSCSQSRSLQGALLREYQKLLSSGQLRTDPNQEQCLQKLSKLADELPAHTQAVRTFQHNLQQYQARRELQRADLKRQERAEAEAALRQEEQQRSQSQSGVWELLDRAKASMGLQQQPAPEMTVEQRVMLAAADREQRLDRMVGPPPEPPLPPQGLYIHGSVGSGKSLLMDMFFRVLHDHDAVPRRRRVHFNAAMLELHSRLHRLEQERQAMDSARMEQYAQAVALAQLRRSMPGIHPDKVSDLETLQDPEAARQKGARLAQMAVRRHQRQIKAPDRAERLARSNAVVMRRAAQSLIRGHGPQPDGGWAEVASEAAVLCFDEVQITDPFTAIALKGLVEVLMEEGCVVCATSNRAPWELSASGLHEDLFAHFLASLQNACRPVHLSSQYDYRRLLFSESQAQQQMYFFPLDSATETALQEKWRESTAGEPPVAVADTKLEVMFGRTLQVARARGGVAQFSFEELCGRPLGAADYIALAQAFHTVFVVDIPAMSLQLRDKARRFITLIDELYNARTRLVCTAACPQDELFSLSGAGEEPIVDLEQLQFESAVEGSRLRRDLMESDPTGHDLSRFGPVSRTSGSPIPVTIAPSVTSASSTSMKRPRPQDDSDHSDSTDIHEPSVADLYVMGLYNSGHSIKQPDCTAALTLINLSLRRSGPSSAELHDWFEDFEQGTSKCIATASDEDEEVEAATPTSGPAGPKTLCNACGVKFSRHQQKGKPGVKHHPSKKIKQSSSHQPGCNPGSTHS